MRPYLLGGMCLNVALNWPKTIPGRMENLSGSRVSDILTNKKTFLLFMIGYILYICTDSI